jgi:uncharacterized protein (DUF362 family)
LYSEPGLIKSEVDKMGDDRRRSGWDRRRFLGTAAWAGAVAAAGCGGKKDAELMDGYDPAAEPDPPTRVDPDLPRAVVSAAGVGGPDPALIERAVREAVEAAGGLGEIERGQRALIKPNMCGPAIRGRIPSGRITTNPEVVRAVIRLCKERGAGEVIVSDRSMFWTEFAMKSCGFAKVCQEEGVTAFPWTRAEYIRFTPGKKYWRTGFRIPKILTEVDHFINVPQLKNHGAVRGADFTCCLKSFVGVCHPEDRHLGGPDELHDLRISAKVAELNLSARPTINIVDATQIMVSGGPDGLSKKRSVWVDADLIMASKDRVACDTLALAALKRHASERGVDLPYVERPVWDQPQIYYAGELGIGQADPTKIDLMDLKVPLFDEFKDSWSRS